MPSCRRPPLSRNRQTCDNTANSSREKTMSRQFWLVVGVSLGAMVAASTGASAQALSGTVSSVQEGRMEGVLVSLKKEGSTVATTVVSNDKGEYSFPANRIAPGRYAT